MRCRWSSVGRRVLMPGSRPGSPAQGLTDPIRRRSRLWAQRRSPHSRLPLPAVTCGPASSRVPSMFRTSGTPRPPCLRTQWYPLVLSSLTSVGQPRPGHQHAVPWQSSVDVLCDGPRGALLRRHECARCDDDLLQRLGSGSGEVRPLLPLVQLHEDRWLCTCRGRDEAVCERIDRHRLELT